MRREGRQDHVVVPTVAPTEGDILRRATSPQFPVNGCSEGTMDGLGVQESHNNNAAPLFALSIISYGHSKGPLQIPQPQSPQETVEHLTFSVRNIENPPVKLRKTHTGLSSRLRKETMASKSATAKLETMRAAVETRMEEMNDAFRGDGAISTADDAFSPPPSPSPSALLVVGIMCEEGKHRSVTFAEELGRKIRADASWSVSVQHRDLGLMFSDDRAAGGGGGGGDSDDENNSSKKAQSGRKGKKQRDQERKKGRSSDWGFARESGSIDDADGGD